MEKFLFATSTQKVLKYLIGAENKSWERAIVQKKTKLSKAGVNLAFRQLVQSGLVEKAVRGKTNIYKIDFSHPVVKQLKVLRTVININKLINKIDPLSHKIMLFGSASRGEDLPDSDIDMLIISRNKEAIKILINKNKKALKIQIIIKTPKEFSELKRKDRYFYEEINQGIILKESYE